ncbi:Sensor histidine kinase ComP [compost metagenome]
MALFRVITQLISNTLKHAEASAVNLIFNYTGNELVLTYYDNGKGFDADLLSKPHGMGMQNIKSRLQMIDAIYHIETGSGKGFKIIIHVSCAGALN